MPSHSLYNWKGFWKPVTLTIQTAYVVIGLALLSTSGLKSHHWWLKVWPQAAWKPTLKQSFHKSTLQYKPPLLVITSQEDPWFLKVLNSTKSMSRALNTCYEQSKNEIKKIIPLTKASNRILRNKLNKRNTKLTFWKIQNIGERKDLNKWKDIPRLWVGRFNTLKMVILHQFIYGVDVSLSKF